MEGYMPSSVKKSWVDALTFREIKVGDRIKLNSENGITLDLIVEDIYDDDSLLLKKPDAVVISNVKEKFSVLRHCIRVSGTIFRPNDKLLVKTSDKKVHQMKVEMILNKDFIIIGPVNSKKKIGVIDKLKLFWR